MPLFLEIEENHTVKLKYAKVSGFIQLERQRNHLQQENIIDNAKTTKMKYYAKALARLHIRVGPNCQSVACSLENYLR